tara:strand:+ start:802 stop:1899 length:1098 start_codon:yes stop_codon:yes gene_type:complete
MNTRIKIALVGCGRISKNHLKAIIYHYKISTLSAICDTNQEMLNSAQDLISQEKNKFNVSDEAPIEYKDLQSLMHDIRIKKININLVVLATPSGLHAEQTILAAKHKINVCTEKPMAVKYKDGCQMIEVCKENNVKLFVVKQNRFNSTLQLLKKQVELGRFGKIALVSVNVFWQRPQSYYDQDEWRGTLELDGGALMNQASHYVDLLDWLIGPVESVSASIATISRNIEAEDTAAIKIKWKNGTLGTLGVTMLTYPKNLEGSITILGENGTVKIGGTAVNKIEKWQFKDENKYDLEVANSSYESDDVYGKGHYPYYKNMINNIKNNEEAICTGNEGLKSLELLEASYRSAKEEKVIKLPLLKSHH